MKIRWKILILLLGVALIPIGAMRWAAYKGMRSLGAELSEHTRSVLIERACSELGQLVKDHAMILEKQTQAIGLALRDNSLELQQRLLGPKHPVFPYHLAQSEHMRQLPPEDSAPSDRIIAKGQKKGDPLYLATNKVCFHLPPDADKDALTPAMESLSSMNMPCEQISQALGDAVYWQFTCLESGLYMAYPAHDVFTTKWDPRKTWWYEGTKIKRGLLWTQPFADPVTGEVLMNAVVPLANPKLRTFMGVTGISVPVSVLLGTGDTQDMATYGYESFLVLYEEDGTGTGARVMAGETGQRTPMRMHMGWHVPPDKQWLQSSDTKEFKAFLEDLTSHKAGVRFMEYESTPSIWAYAPIREKQVLLFITPEAEVTQKAEEAGDFVRAQIGHQIKVTGAILAVVLLLMLTVTLILSKRVSRLVTSMADAFRLVAGGDFTARAPVRGKDEFAEMSATFNSMVPALEDQVRMKNALELAREVQLNLLPGQTPSVPGLEVAGGSEYCDETGGDLYDFIQCENNPSCLGVVVGDVSGHGIPAAMLMTTIRAFLRCRALDPDGLGKAITGVNNLVTADTTGSGRFMTMFFLVVDASTREIRWVRAGHDPALLYDPKTGEFTELQGEGLPLGIVEETEYQDSKLKHFDPGQIVLIGTDGIWETRDPESGEMFGKERVKDIIRAHAREPARDIYLEILKAVAEFSRQAPRHDDITLTIVKSV